VHDFTAYHTIGPNAAALSRTLPPSVRWQRAPGLGAPAASPGRSGANHASVHIDAFHFGSHNTNITTTTSIISSSHVALPPPSSSSVVSSLSGAPASLFWCSTAV